jgi:hypothetical protein
VSKYFVKKASTDLWDDSYIEIEPEPYDDLQEAVAEASQRTLNNYTKLRDCTRFCALLLQSIPNL